MVLGILNEQHAALVATVPANIKKLKKNENIEVYFESGCGASAYFEDALYEEAGAVIKKRDEILTQADIVCVTKPLDKKEAEKLKKDCLYISSFRPYIFEDVLNEVKGKSFRAFSLDMIPRISRAQSMDVLSSMASIAGFSAVITATEMLPRYFPMMITAAGSIPPSTVLVIGAGVAGLQAIATARRLGARVEVMDTRASAKEEAESLGGKFLELEGAKDDKAAGGYAVEQSADFIQRQRQFTAEACGRADVIICTALVRGKKSPVIVTEEAVKNMRNGSVIIDLASVSGGNCQLTEPEKVVEKYGVRILGSDILHEKMPQDASILFSNNCYNFIQLFFDKEHHFNINMDDELISSTRIN